MEDWRLMGQEIYLKNKELYAVLPYEYAKTRSDGDFWHEHCEFCGTKITKNYKKRVFYCTTDYYHWICSKCYNDFKEMFGWIVVNQNDNNNQEDSK